VARERLSPLPASSLLFDFNGDLVKSFLSRGLDRLRGVLAEDVPLDAGIKQKRWNRNVSKYFEHYPARND
jgi:hypothetical protein